MPQHLQVSRHPASNRRLSRRLQSIEFEPPTVAHRMMRTERRITCLRDRTNILRTKVENQDSLIVSLESEVEEAQLKIELGHEKKEKSPLEGERRSSFFLMTKYGFHINSRHNFVDMNKI